MKKIVLLLLAVVAWSLNDEVSAQNIAAVKSRLAAGDNPVSVVEQSDASMAVRTIEQKPKRGKVTGYTILLLSDYHLLSMLEPHS